MNTNLCCLIKPEWICDSCGLRACRQCWAVEYVGVSIFTYSSRPDKEFCSNCPIPEDSPKTTWNIICANTGTIAYSVSY